jgi:hypothetical protein
MSNHEEDKLFKYATKEDGFSFINLIEEINWDIRKYDFKSENLTFNPTELIELDPAVYKSDMIMELDSIIVITEFQSTVVKKFDEKRYRPYTAIVDYAKQNNKPILLIVFSTAEKTKIKQYKLNKDCVFTIPIISLKDFDGDEIINNIENKIKNNTKITRRELIYLSLAPFMSSIKTSNHSHGSLVNDGALNSDITSVNKVAVTDATNKLKTISKLPLDKVTHQDISGKANVNHSHDSASSSANGFLSKEDKSKLDGIATEANKTVVDSSLSSSSTNPVQNKVVNSALNGKANSSHSHSISNITNLQSALDSKSETGHTHDDRYYTETEMNTKLNGKANSSHTHTASQISDLTVSTHTLANGAKLYKYGKIVLAVFNNYPYSGKTPNVWTDIFNIPSAYKPISTDNIYGHWSGSTGQIVAGSNKISIFPPTSNGSVFGHILWITS